MTVKPKDAEATRLKRDAEKRQREIATQSESDRKYGQAMAEAQTAFDHQDFASVANKADAVLAIRPGDPAAQTDRRLTPACRAPAPWSL